MASLLMGMGLPKSEVSTEAQGACIGDARPRGFDYANFDVFLR